MHSCYSFFTKTNPHELGTKINNMVFHPSLAPKPCFFEETIVFIMVLNIIFEYAGSWTAAEPEKECSVIQNLSTLRPLKKSKFWIAGMLYFRKEVEGDIFLPGLAWAWPGPGLAWAAWPQRFKPKTSNLGLAWPGQLGPRRTTFSIFLIFWC